MSVIGNFTTTIDFENSDDTIEIIEYGALFEKKDFKGKGAKIFDLYKTIIKNDYDDLSMINFIKKYQNMMLTNSLKQGIVGLIMLLTSFFLTIISRKTDSLMMGYIGMATFGVMLTRGITSIIAQIVEKKKLKKIKREVLTNLKEKEKIKSSQLIADNLRKIEIKENINEKIDSLRDDHLAEYPLFIETIALEEKNNQNTFNNNYDKNDQEELLEVKENNDLSSNNIEDENNLIKLGYDIKNASYAREKLEEVKKELEELQKYSFMDETHNKALKIIKKM